MPRAQPIKDRSVITDHVHDVIGDIYPSQSIDRIAARPLDMFDLGLQVGRRAGRITATQERKMRKWLESRPFFAGHDDGVIDTINEIGRTAFASRKRGELKKDRA